MTNEEIELLRKIEERTEKWEKIIDWIIALIVLKYIFIITIGIAIIYNIMKNG